MAIIDGEFLRLKEFNEVKLNADIQDFLEDAHSSFTSKGALNPREPRFKRSLIHYAAMGDCSELLHFLLATGAARDDRDLNSRTPLSWAAEHGALKSVKILLEDGAEINSMDDMFSNAFVVAGTRGCSYATIGRHGSLSEAERCARVRCQAMLDPAEDQNALTDSQGQISSAQSFSDRPTNLTPPVIGVRWQSWSAGLDWKTVPMIKLQVLALQQPPENRFPISPKDGPRIQEYLEDVHYASHRAACEPLKLLSACVLNDLDIFGKVPDRVQNAKSNIGIINEIIEQTNIERGRRPEEGVIDLITLNHYWKLRRADSLHNKTEQKNFTDSNISIVRMLEQYPIGWKDLPISDLMCYKFDDDYYWKGFWDSVEPGRLDESQLITFIRTGSYPSKHHTQSPIDGHISL
ncbi:hypothetical protein KXV36_003410 [Aspergillus fumigatus]|nr:hypothetical protein KXX47_000672 [Aspergillus fumigatus]KAH1386440.1 hypothetical protein KXX10_004019 [Aspergillus fumigatus]KAH1464506.1 hypothetical protein KXX58_006576 [Aspergillus fumigatus]KAH1488939.1 hypothetical protein KXX42_001599 [Aspergillus fumigatus]KAH1665396.1 hypothetical protein KXX65_000909 [Aspergillus fumigatus]